MSDEGELTAQHGPADRAEPRSTPSEHRDSSADMSAGPSTTSPQDTPATLRSDLPSLKPKVRASRACSSCNKQKLRCDGGHPCSRCIHHDKRGECEYLPSMRGKTRKRKSRPDEPVDRAARPRRNSSPPRIAPRRVESPSTRAYPPILGSQMAYWKRHDLLSRHRPLKRILEDDADRLTIKDFGALDNTDNIDGPTLPPISSVFLGKARAHVSYPSHQESRREPHTPTVSQPSLELLAEASFEVVDIEPLSMSTNRRPSRHSFGPPVGERTLRESLPSVLSIITTQQAEDLFILFFKAYHPHCPFLDPERCQPDIVARRSHELFNAICLVASRSADGVSWHHLQEFAGRELERFPSTKNLETVQALLLYAIWDPLPVRSSEKNLAWLRMGLAVRLSIEMGLPELVDSTRIRTLLPGWAARSIERTWRVASAIDQIWAAEMGKPAVAGSVLLTWGNLIHDNGRTPSDLLISALSDWAQLLLQAIADFRNELGNLGRRGSDFGFQDSTLLDAVSQYDKQFRLWRTEYERRLSHFDRESKRVQHISATLELYDRYGQLIVASYAVQRAKEVAPSEAPSAVTRLRRLAARLVHVFEVEYETLEAHGTLGAPDQVHNILTYAAISLFNTMDPGVSETDSAECAEIRMIVRSASEMLRRAGQSAGHRPAVQGEYLRQLIDAKKIDWTRVSPSGSGSLLDLQQFREMLDLDPSVNLWPPPPSTRQEDMQVAGREKDSLSGGLVDFEDLSVVLPGSNLLFGNFGRGADWLQDLGRA